VGTAVSATTLPTVMNKKTEASDVNIRRIEKEPFQAVVPTCPT